MILRFLENLVFSQISKKSTISLGESINFDEWPVSDCAKCCVFSKEIVKIPNLTLEVRFGSILKICENRQGFIGFGGHEVFPST